MSYPSGTGFSGVRMPEAVSHAYPGGVMAKRTRITATYRLNEAEAVQVSIAIPKAYPDALAEAKATVLAMMREELADVMAQNPAPVQVDEG